VTSMRMPCGGGAALGPKSVSKTLFPTGNRCGRGSRYMDTRRQIVPTSLLGGRLAYSRARPVGLCWSGVIGPSQESHVTQDQLGWPDSDPARDVAPDQGRPSLGDASGDATNYEPSAGRAV
jgi:hypothetical protein